MKTLPTLIFYFIPDTNLRSEKRNQKGNQII